MKRENRNRLYLVLLCVLSILPAIASADPGNQYCITPPFITAGVKPNLLMLIDNSASMYDLVYTDPTEILFCANSPSTSCTTKGATCAGAAICKVTATSTTTTTTSPVACTTNAECAAVLAGDTCNTGKGQCKRAVSTVTTTTTTPTACTSDADCTAPNDTCNNKCTSTTRPCFDDTYNSTLSYTGYFNQTRNYCYSTKSNKTTCDYSGSYDEFDGGAVMPASCTYGGSSSTTPYVCVDTATDAGSGKEYVSNFVASGKFLNWLTMSKFDIEKSILTGGKYRVDMGGDLVAESRGCGGRKFIKSLPALPALSFGIRGGLAAVGNTSQATQYGTTYIEIYKGTYNEDACTAALNDWQQVSDINMGPLQVDTKNCIGGTGSISDELAAANQTIHDCFWYFNGHGLSNTQPIKNTCAKIYQSKSPSDIISASQPDAICSNALSHAVSLEDGNTTGYLGLCFTGGTWNDSCVLTENKDYCQGVGGGGVVTDPSSESSVSETVQSIPGFVMELGLGNLTMINDYSVLSPVPANATKGFPVLVYDPAGFSSWPPTGLIQKYKDTIRFGAMTFQNNGSGTECGTSGVCSATSPADYRGDACSSDANCGGGKCIFTIPCAKTCSNLPERQCNSSTDCNYTNPATGVSSTGTCGGLAKSDGGKIVSYVGSGFCSSTTTQSCYVDADCAGLSPSGQYCNPSIGDHSSGLLRAIDDIQATAWTPFAEAFYNAMGYLARSNAYTVSSTTAPTSRSDADFSTLPSPNTTANYVTNRNPSQFRCQSNNLLLITDGMSTADQSSVVDDFAELYAPQVPYTIGATTYKPADNSTTPVTPATTGYNSANNFGYDATNKCPSYSGSRSINTLAWVAKNRDIKTLTTSSPASTTAPVTSSESINTYVVYSGPTTSSQPGLCDPRTLMSNTATNGGTSLLEAQTPEALNTKIEAAFSTVAAKAASGTAASILSNSEGSGANILQAVFYPKKIFEQSTSVNWIGEMQNLWYFVDPYIQNSTIREDTDKDLKLNLVNDYIVRFAFDNSQDKTMVQRYNDANGDSVVTDTDKVGDKVDPDYVNSIWRAGLKLWSRDDTVSSTARTIYTGYNSTPGSTPQLFTKANLNPSTTYATSLWDALQIPAGTDLQRYGLTNKLIDYIRGTDQANDSVVCLNTDCEYRKRRVTIGFCSNASEKRCTTATVATDCPTGGTCSMNTYEWKLGDIISSTPRVQSTVRLNTYNLPPSGGYNDKSYQSFVNSDNYQDNGMVYVGANDGMLHAFSLGLLDVTAKGFQKAELKVPTGTIIGKEKWAFIPKHSIPFLKYFSDKNYNHIYYVDGRTTLLDASIGDTGSGSCVRATYWECDKPRNGSIAFVDSSNNLTTANTWRTVVIAGMGLGGASVDPSVTACTEGGTGNCVKTPRPGLGYSSYFAFDVTDPDNPLFLWEFSNSNLGFATTAPTIVRIGDKDKNGRWFAIFGNGPLGPIDSGSNQFKGESVNHVRFFVVDLRTGDLVTTLNDTDTLGLTNAFVGTMLGGSIDADRRDATASGHYQDDAIYAGYVQKTTGTGWTDGGVLRIMTKEDINPANWVVSKVISGIGPVTTSIARTQDTKNRNLWLYFGTGRFYFRDAVGLDDNDTRRSLFGIQEPCYNTTTRPGNMLDPNCTTELSTSAIKDQTTTVGAMTSTDKGWQILLDSANSSTNEGAERVVTDTVALTNGTVFYTTFKPTMDICGYGGNSYLWGVKYDTGGAALASALVGKALIQLSTGEFKEVDLSTAFTDKQGRRMESPMTGKPPSDAPPIVSSSSNRPVKKILHIQEH
jgi:type IV pilus assembly protein PilY1